MRVLPYQFACMVRSVTLIIDGRVIDDPMTIWRGYAGRTRTLNNYDLAGQGNPGILTEGDVARTRIIASRISRDECERLLKRADGAPWDCVSAEADLAAADPARRGGLFDQAAALYWHFTVPHEAGLGPAKIHKVLHVKRPGVYPVLDRLVRRLYRVQARKFTGLIPGARPGGSVTFWAAIREDLIDAGNHSAVLHYRAALRADPQTAPMAGLPFLRLLDIVSWETARKEANAKGLLPEGVRVSDVQPDEAPARC
jgi:uncharacterized protein DUF6308